MKSKVVCKVICYVKIMLAIEDIFFFAMSTVLFATVSINLLTFELALQFSDLFFWFSGCVSWYIKPCTLFNARSCLYILAVFLSFVIPFPFFFLFVGCMHPQMTFQPCQITSNFTADSALSIALASMNVMRRSSRLDMFAHMAFDTS